MLSNSYVVLGLRHGATIDEIKKAYKNIAINCHPDKLNKNMCESERNEKIEDFKKATMAYQNILSNYRDINNTDNTNEDFNDDIDDIDWKDMWKTFFNNSTETKDIIKDMFSDIVSVFRKSKIYSKTYYNPRPRETVDHSFTLNVTLNDICKNSKKKLRLVIASLEEPLFIDIFCGKFPTIVREYNDDDDLEHIITINMKIVGKKGFESFVSDAGSIDIITVVNIDLLDYLTGSVKTITYIDDSAIEITIPAFHTEFMEIPNKGIAGGSFIVNVVLKNIDQQKWKQLPPKDSTEMIRIMSFLAKTI
jgi:DnaJ-class molecular chaperone